MTQPKQITIAGTYKSRSSQGDKHQVRRNKAGGLNCTCKGWQYTGHCWHTDKVLERLVAHHG